MALSDWTPPLCEHRNKPIDGLTAKSAKYLSDRADKKAGEKTGIKWFHPGCLSASREAKE